MADIFIPYYIFSKFYLIKTSRKVSTKDDKMVSHCRLRHWPPRYPFHTFPSTGTSAEGKRVWRNVDVCFRLEMMSAIVSQCILQCIQFQPWRLEDIQYFDILLKISKVSIHVPKMDPYKCPSFAILESEYIKAIIKFWLCPFPCHRDKILQLVSQTFVYNMYHPTSTSTSTEHRHKWMKNIVANWTN